MLPTFGVRQEAILILLVTVLYTTFLTSDALPADFLCGNGKLDDGEDCDGDKCCENCKFKLEGTVCREAYTDCDVPEYCTGTSEECPLDLIDMTKCLPNTDTDPVTTDTEKDVDTSDGYGYGGDSRYGYSPASRPIAATASISASSPSTEFNPNPHPHPKYPGGRLFDFENDVNGNNLEDLTSTEYKCPVDDLNRVCSGNGKCIADNACLCYVGWVGNACSHLVDTNQRQPSRISRKSIEAIDENNYFMGMIMIVFILVVSLLGIIATFSKVYMTNQRNNFKRF